MKKKSIIAYCIILTASILLSSCGVLVPDPGRPSRCYNPYKYCIMKDGIWGRWESYWLSYERSMVKYNSQKCDIYIYEVHNHPSDYDFKITINKQTAKKTDGDWTEYEGEIIVSNTSVADTYTLNDSGRRIKCTIRTDKKMTKALEKGGLWGTINIFYGNGRGRAFSFFPS